METFNHCVTFFYPIDRWFFCPFFFRLTPVALFQFMLEKRLPFGFSDGSIADIYFPSDNLVCCAFQLLFGRC